MQSLTIPADFLSVRQLGEWIPQQLTLLFGASTSAQHAAAVELCVHELAINIVEHAYANYAGSISFTAQAASNKDAVRFEVTDDGLDFDFDPSADTEPGAPSVRGYGLMIVKTLASSIAYQRKNGQNQWTLTFEVTSAAPQARQQISQRTPS